MNQFRVYCPKMKEKSLPASSTHPHKVPKSGIQPSSSPPHTRCKYTERPAQYNFKDQSCCPLRQITPKQAKVNATVFTSFIRELPGNHSFSDLIIKSVLNYRTGWHESQCLTSRTNKHAKIKCSGLLPEGCCQRQQKWPLSPSLGCPGKLHTSPGRQFPTAIIPALQSNLVLNK